MEASERDLLAMVIGYRIRRLRIEKDLSQGDLANGIGSQSMVSLIESGRQLPLPDVVELLANRLQDDKLHEYARLLKEDQLRSEMLSDSNEQELFDILSSHRGRWHAVHFRLALQLCDHFYMNHSHIIVQELCKMILAQSKEGEKFYAEACFYHGSSFLVLGDFEPAERWLRKAEAYGAQLDTRVRARLLYNLGYLFTVINVQGTALLYADQAVQAFHSLQDFRRYATALGLLGSVQERIGRLDDSRKTLELAYEIASKWDLGSVNLARIATSLLGVYYLLGSLDEAMELVDESYQVIEESGDASSQYILHYTQYRIYMDRGAYDEAEHSVAQAMAIANQTSDPGNQAYTELATLDHHPSTQAKLQAALRAYDITLGTPSHIEHALAAECAAYFYEELGNTEYANTYRVAALDAYRSYVAKNSNFAPVIQRLPMKLPEGVRFPGMLRM